MPTQSLRVIKNLDFKILFKLPSYDAETLPIEALVVSYLPGLSKSYSNVELEENRIRKNVRCLQYINLFSFYNSFL